MAKAYQNIFKSEDGNLVLADIMSRGYVTKTTQAVDVNTTLANEGARTMALYILGMININIDQLIERIQTNAQTLNDAE